MGDLVTRPLPRCPSCREPAPCHRCVAPPQIEAPGWVDWLAGVGFILLLVFLVLWS